MSVEPTSGDNRRRVNALASEVARHQQFKDSADFSFNSRRLHHSTRPRQRMRRMVP
jgi:hypothetical protein